MPFHYSARLAGAVGADTLTAIGNRPQSGFFEPLLHIACLQRVDHLVKLALHKKIQIVESQTDSMIGDAILWKIIGPDLFLSSSGPDQTAPVRRILFRFRKLLFLK